ncbi:MAG TPA: glycosyltransferase [Acidimicrobiales bacterium]|nr:glycosyltransferase [Acidimicrobiales bacterium]
MERPAVSIVVPVWNAWEMTRACLDSLRPTLRYQDQVIVVDNGSTDGTATGLRRYPWVELVTNEENLGFAVACNQGAARAMHPAVVFLNNDTVVPPRWVEPLVGPLTLPGVVATGPRSNFVSGPQLVSPCPYPAGSVAAMKRFARDWARDHAGQTTDVDRLVGFCLAVDTDAFRAVGGFDEGFAVGGYEDDDLCLRLRQAGGRLVIAHASFVHHWGHATFDANGISWSEQEMANRSRFLAKQAAPAGGPLVSACLIVKDEEENLPACLDALQGFADEVVVYDTGSTDTTVELARSLGARVVEGKWEDDFARARNASLEHCKGAWILWIDADEVLVGDLAAVRRRLAAEAPAVEGYQVQIENVLGSGLGSRSIHPACRLFRRSVGRWSGRLHEQVTGPAGRHLTIVALPEARVLHHGYTDEMMERRNKVERNLRLARAELDRAADPIAAAAARANLARTLFIARRFEESLVECAAAAELTTDGITRRLALRMGIENLLALERPEDAAEWVDRLRAASSRRVLADIMEARVLLTLGRDDEALALLERLGPRESDEDAFEYTSEVTAPLRARALARTGRTGEAADALIAALRNGACDVHVGTILELLAAEGRSPTELVAAVPAHFTTAVLAQVLQLAPEPADVLLEAWWTERPDDLRALAAGASVAPRLAIVRTLEWSARVRGRGLAGACPLLAVAADEGRPADERARAAVVAFGTFGDPSARTALLRAMGDADPSELAAIRGEAVVLCPALATDPQVMGGPEPAPAAGIAASASTLP